MTYFLTIGSYSNSFSSTLNIIILTTRMRSIQHIRRSSIRSSFYPTNIIWHSCRLAYPVNVAYSADRPQSKRNIGGKLRRKYVRYNYNKVSQHFYCETGNSKACLATLMIKLFVTWTELIENTDKHDSLAGLFFLYVYSCFIFCVSPIQI
jgi:hypothetical protein